MYALCGETQSPTHASRQDRKAGQPRPGLIKSLVNGEVMVDPCRFFRFARMLDVSFMRTASLDRSTRETDISIALNLDGSGVADIATGIGFLDHMLDQIARHSLFDLTVKANGDLHIDMHHTAEDVGIALGTAFRAALGDKTGITRYAETVLPMDEALTRVALDISGRPFLVWRVAFPSEKIGAFDTELVREWFNAFAINAGITLHVETFYGDNSHHIAESCFKALARALRMATQIDPRNANAVPSTKGSL